MTIQKLYKKAVDNGYSAEIKQLVSEKYAVFVYKDNSINFVDDIYKIYRKSPVHIDWRAFGNVAFIMLNSDYELLEKFNSLKFKLSEVFWMAIRDGKSAEDAKSIQHDYAVENNCVEIFNSIYE